MTMVESIKEQTSEANEFKASNKLEEKSLDVATDKKPNTVTAKNRVSENLIQIKSNKITKLIQTYENNSQNSIN